MPVPFSRSIIPSAPLFIVMRDFGPKLGFESVTDPNATRASIAADIVSGQIDRVAYVIEVDGRDGTSRDITDDVVADCAALARELRAA